MIHLKRFLVFLPVMMWYACSGPKLTVFKYAFEGDSLEKRVDAKGKVSWNRAALKFSENWKTEAGSQTDPFRKKSAEFLDADSSLLIGLTEKEVIAFLGPFENEQKNGYRYDKYYDDKNQYFGCWIVLSFDAGQKVTDVSRICP